MTELVLGCKPCVEKVVINGEPADIDETIVAAEREGYTGIPVSVSDSTGMRWFQEDGLQRCPETGNPCPNSGRINSAAEFVLRDMRLILQNGPSPMADEALGYLEPTN